jgi:hypothetical protein
MAIGALLHIAAVVIGAKAYAFLGAPAGLVAMVGTGSARPTQSCFVIAGLLLVGAVYGASGAGLGPRLPAWRLVLFLFAIGLVARGVLLPVAAAWRPYVLSGICGRCQEVNGFVLLTSALCVFVGAVYAAGAFRRVSDNSRKPNGNPAQAF